MILDKATQRYYRSILFKHQDGGVITGIVNTLLTKGVISFLDKEKCHMVKTQSVATE